jgi:hypothetical protein
MLCLEITMFRFLRKTSLYILALPLLFTALGIASNQAVLAANHDKFPVQWNDYKVSAYAVQLDEESKATNEKGEPTAAAKQAHFNLVALDNGYLDETHCLMTSETHLNFLADYLDFHTATYSPGDAFIELGEWLGVFSLPVWFFAVVQKLRKSGDSVYGNTRSY